MIRETVSGGASHRCSSLFGSSDLWSKLAILEMWRETPCSSLPFTVNRTRFSGTRWVSDDGTDIATGPVAQVVRAHA
jgi:hypothetical protein